MAGVQKTVSSSFSSVSDLTVKAQNERMALDKAAPIKDLWLMLNANLKSAHKPTSCLTVDEQLFQFKGCTKFTQNIPSKPAMYGIKIFWICDAESGYPLEGEIYTGKSIDYETRNTNIDKPVVLDLEKKIQKKGQECDNCDK